MNGECRPLGCEPLFSRGEVIRGFGRGSKDLGIPTGNSAKHIPCDKPTLCTETWETLSAYVEVDCLPVSRKKNFRGTPSSISFPATANYPEDVVENLPDNFETGIYYGWASVNRGPVYKMVMSVGWNPFYKNQKKSMETHIIHTFAEDFYGEELSTVVLGYLRPEKNYQSLGALIEAIHADIKSAEELLEKPGNRSFATHPFFTDRQ